MSIYSPTKVSASTQLGTANNVFDCDCSVYLAPITVTLPGVTASAAAGFFCLIQNLGYVSSMDVREKTISFEAVEGKVSEGVLSEPFRSDILWRPTHVDATKSWRRVENQVTILIGLVIALLIAAWMR